MMSRKLVWAGALAMAALPLTASATDGYFSHGYGVIAKGMGGAATAVTQDTFGGANNPASMVWVGNRIDAGIALFSPRRSAERKGNGIGPFGHVTSDSNAFPIPGFGYNHLIGTRTSLGVTVYANGGMNTDYEGKTLAANHCGMGAPTSNLLCGQGRLGVNLEQLVVAPTLSFKISPRNSIGISPLLVYQRFKAEGLQAFKAMSSAPSAVTNKGTDDSFGLGGRIGWMGKLNQYVTLGASYSPQTDMDRFDKYKGLFANKGSFDIPENVSLGIALKPTSQLLVAIDYQRIYYGRLDSVGNSSQLHNPLGSDEGPGFGWQNIDVYKLGVAYQSSANWTWRLGYNHSDNPIRKQDVTFNILAPGVVKDHATLGFSYHTKSGGELSVAYMHAFKNSVSGQSAFFPGKETIEMSEDELSVGYGWQF